jgi:hypothetical protein
LNAREIQTESRKDDGYRDDLPDDTLAAFENDAGQPEHIASYYSKENGDDGGTDRTPHAELASYTKRGEGQVMDKVRS